MKKFLLSGCVCTPSVKGIYTVLFVLILTLPAFAQIEMKDSKTDVPFYKWSVDFDLKPLFRKEEPFSLLVKRYTSATKAWRFGVGLSASKSPISNSYLDIYTPSTTVTFFSEKTSNQIGSYLTIGRQFEKKIEKLFIYTSSDITVKIDFIKDKSNGTSLSTNATTSVPVNRLYVDTLLNRKILGLTLSQSLGFKYHVNKQISISMEANGSLNIDKIMNNQDAVGILANQFGVTFGNIPFASKDNRWLYYLKFNPMAHIYLSYHF